MVSPTLNATLGLSQSIFESRNLLSDLQEQLATGKKVKTYGDLGIVRNQILSLRSEIAQVGAYQKVGTQASIRMDVMVQSLERMQDLASSTRSDAMLTGFELQASGQTVYQKEVGGRLDEIISLLNASAGGRQLFSGRETETLPVVGPGVMLDGKGGQAGFRQIVDERRQADLGADGLGRLVLGGPEASMLGTAVADLADIGGAAAAEFTIDIGGNIQTFDISDGGIDDLAALEAAIDTAFGGDVATIVNGNQLQLTAPNATDSITITDVDAGAAALAGLTTGAAADPGTITLAEDFAGSPFGFKLSEVNSQLSGTTVTGPAGGPPPQLDVQFGGTLPQNGETIRIGFTLPDGTTQDITMTARTSGPLGEGEFLVGADASETATSFQTALTSSIETEAQRSLSAASLFAASNDFFDFDAANPPQRVDGPPFDTATALVDATAANTVFWYKGEDSATDARTSALARVDDAVTTAYGARANEDAMRTVVKYFAAISVETFDVNDPNSQKRYTEMAQRANTGLSFGGSNQSLDDVITEIAVAKSTVERASERHKANEAILQGFVDEEEKADVYEVAASILQLQNRLQASLQVTASLNSLSLVNFI